MFKSKLNLTLATALLFTGATWSFGQSAAEQEAKLIAVLKSDAPQKDKADACRALAVSGTKNAVAALAALLPDEKMNHMARYALETIPDASADEALRSALDNLKGRPLVGVIGSIGVRRDAKAVSRLADFLQDGEAEVAQAAARALGKIGTAAAAKAIEAALARTPAGNYVAFCEGLFRCAEALTAAGQKGDAQGIYDRLRGLQNAPHQVRAGALRGAVMVRGKDGIPLLLQGVRSEDYVLTAAAARTALEMPGPEITQALAAELPKLTGDKQILIIQTLGKRGDAGAQPALFALAKSGPKANRVEAVKTLPEIGHADAVPVLVGLLKDADVGQAAKDALGGFPGKAADAAVMAMLSSAENQLTGIELVARRRMKSAIPLLSKAATDANQEVRAAAIKRLGELGGAAELPVLVDLLLKSTSSQDLGALEQGLSAISTTVATADESASHLVATMAKAQPAQKCALLRILGVVGGDKALQAVRAAVNDTQPEVHAAAIRVLGEWKTPEVADALLELAKSSTKSTDKVLCLRSYLKIASSQDVPAQRKIAMCKEAAALIQNEPVLNQRDDEKKLLLGVLGGINSPEVAALIMPYLDNPGTKEEACAALVAAAERAQRGRGAPKAASRWAEPLQKVVTTTANAALKQKAQTLLKQTRGPTP